MSPPPSLSGKHDGLSGRDRDRRIAAVTEVGGPDHAGGTVALDQPAVASGDVFIGAMGTDGPGVRRFVLASVIGTGVAAVPFLWIL